MGSGRLWLPSRRHELQTRLAGLHAPKPQPPQVGPHTTASAGLSRWSCQAIGGSSYAAPGRVSCRNGGERVQRRGTHLEGLVLLGRLLQPAEKSQRRACHQVFGTVPAGQLQPTWSFWRGGFAGWQPMLGRRASSARGCFECRGTGGNSTASCFFVRWQNDSKPAGKDEEIQPDRRSTREAGAAESEAGAKKCVTEVGY